MKKKTDDLVNEIISSKTMNHYLNTNQEEFLEMPLQVYLKQLLEKSKCGFPRWQMRRTRENIFTRFFAELNVQAAMWFSALPWE